MTDDSIINLSEETKAKLRNYVMVVGFLGIFISAVIMVGVSMVGEKVFPQLFANIVPIASVLSVPIMVSGIALALLHKRDLVAITFIAIGTAVLLPAFGMLLTGKSTVIDSYNIMLIIIGVMFLLTNNEQRLICSPLLVIDGLMVLAVNIDGAYIVLSGVINGILAIITAFCMFCLVSENTRFPGYSILTADEEDASKDGEPVHFKITGSVLGYILLAAPMLEFGLYYLNGFTEYNNAVVLTLSCGVMLVFTGLLMLVAGRMMFTPVLFIGLGTVFALTPYITDFIHSATLVVFVLGLLCLFRKDRRVLVGVAIILYALTYVFTEGMGVVSNNIVSVFLNFIPFFILMYVCLALSSNGRLKLV